MASLARRWTLYIFKSILSNLAVATIPNSVHGGVQGEIRPDERDKLALAWKLN